MQLWLTEEGAGWGLVAHFLCVRFADPLSKRLFFERPDLRGYVQSRLDPWGIPGLTGKVRVRWVHLLLELSRHTGPFTARAGSPSWQLQGSLLGRLVRK